MTNKDPFFPSKGGGDRTIIRPTPGGRRADAGAARPDEMPARAEAAAPGLRELHSGPGINGLEAAAFQITNAALSFRHSTRQPDLAEVRERMTRFLNSFREQVERLGFSSETIRQAHYALCAFVDEIVLATPWGGQSRWQEHSLLSSYHRQTWGGEEFFRIIEKAKVNAAGNTDLLELLYVLLSLGFEGAYSTVPNGRDKLEQVKASLFQTIRNQRPELERDLSARWRGTDAGKPGLAGLIPLWAFAAIGAGMLLLAYVGFNLSLNRASDPLMARVASLDAEVLTRLGAAPRPPAQATQSALVTLRQLLAEDIAANRVAVESEGQRAIVRIAGDGLFASGSDRVAPALRPVLDRIAGALVQVPGRVVVTGHSDNVPIRSVRFPSNWHLSEARAESVVEILAASSAYPARYSYEGRADTQPLADNSTAEGRARNRRVDISLLPMRSGEDE